MALELPALGALRLPSLLGRRQQGYELPEEEKQSLLKSIGSGLLSGIGVVGSALDVPGSMLRDVLSEENPFDQLLSPFSFENRISGRGMLEKWGALEPNKPGFDWGDVAGFAAEVVADPLMYFGIPGISKARTVAGKIVKDAGLMGSVQRIAAKKLGRTFVGPREAAMTTRLKDVFNLADEPLKAIEALKTAAKGRNLGPLLDEPLGGLVRGEIPFTKIGTTWGKEGGIAQWTARSLDWMGQRIRHGRVSPVRAVADLFSAPYWGMRTLAGRKGAYEHFRALDKAEAAALGQGNELYELAVKAGLHTDDAADDFYRLMEGNRPPANAAQQTLFTKGREFLDAQIPGERSFGSSTKPLVDPLYPKNLYFPRHLSQRVRMPDGSYRTIAVSDASELHRKFPMGIVDGTPTIRAAARHPDVAAAINKVKAIPSEAGKKARDAAVRNVAAEIDKAFPGMFPKGGSLTTAEIFAKMPSEVLEAGVFSNFPLFDFEYRASRHFGKNSAKQSIIHILGTKDSLVPPANWDKWASGVLFKGVKPTNAGDLVPLKTLMKSVNMHNKELAGYERLMKYLGETAPTTERLTDIAKSWYVRKDVADDITRIYERFAKAPEPIKTPLTVIDTFTNLFKAGVTGVAPAFHLRNLSTGHGQEALRGAFSARNDWIVDRLARKMVVPGLAQEPVVARLAALRGINPATLTDQAAGDLIRMAGRQYGVIASGHGEIASKVGAAVPEAKMAEHFGAQYLGGGIQGQGKGFSFLQALRTFAGRPGTGATLDIRKATLRGAIGPEEFVAALKGRKDIAEMMPAIESTFGPFAAGDQVGRYIESMNRLPGWLKEVAAGVDPVEAARRVGAAQVLYHAREYTPFERDVLTRLFPFYKFAKGQAKYVAGTLLERPGGRMAQFIRATNLMREKTLPLPEYVSQGLAIPIPEGTPLVGPEPGGPPRYLNSLQMMHEDLLAFLGGGVQGAGLEALSRLNPLVKGPLETFTGQTFFQRGPFGGRELGKLDPVLGRLAANVFGLEEPAKLPALLEQAAVNTPFSRLLTTARTLTDPRKRWPGAPDVPIPGPAALLNVTTGARLTDVPEAAQEAMLREALTKQLQKRGLARVFQRAYVPKDLLESLPPELQKEAIMSQALLNLLAERAQKRAKGEPVGPIGGNPLLQMAQPRSW